MQNFFGLESVNNGGIPENTFCRNKLSPWCYQMFQKSISSFSRQFGQFNCFSPSENQKFQIHILIKRWERTQALCISQLLTIQRTVRLVFSTSYYTIRHKHANTNMSCIHKRHCMCTVYTQEPMRDIYIYTSP